MYQIFLLSPQHCCPFFALPVMVLVAIAFYLWQTEIECVMRNTLNDASTLVNAILRLFLSLFLYLYLFFCFSFFCFLYFILFYETLDLQTSN